MIITHRIRFTLAFLAGFAVLNECAAQVAVIAGAKSNIGALTKEQVAALYTGSAFVYPSGGNAVLIDQPEASEARKLFYSKISDKSASQIKATWSRLTFSGKGTPPKEVGSSGDVKKEVAANLSEIGYIEKSAVDGSVKVLFMSD